MMFKIFKELKYFLIKNSMYMFYEIKERRDESKKEIFWKLFNFWEENEY